MPFFGVILLNACASFPAGARQRSPAHLSTFRFHARVKIKTPRVSNAVTVYWKQQDEHHYRLYFMGNLGFGSAELIGTPKQVRLTTSRGEHIEAKTPERLLCQQFEWQLPVASLYYWIRGLPAPHHPARYDLDAQERIKTLHQQAWDIRYLRYEKQGPYALPKKNLIEKQSVFHQNNDFPLDNSLKIAII